MRAAALLAFLLALLPMRAHAHPHVFIQYLIEPETRDGAIVSVVLKWRFDDLYSSLVLGTIDRDGDGKLSQPEIDDLAARVIVNTAESGFYTTFKLDGVEWRAPKADGFTASAIDEIVTYAFTIVLPKPARVLEASAHDPQYYIALEADPKQSEVGKGAVACRIGKPETVKDQTWGDYMRDVISCEAKAK